MEQSKLIERIEGFRIRNSGNKHYINKDIYRILYNRELYHIAYNNIRNNDGAETKGSDDTSLHGFSEDWIDEIISSMRDESYQPTPSRITYIPKKDGKMRKLSFPNGRDKLVQECVRILLDSIYEPTFSNLSHGFRPNRSIHSAVAQINTWNGTVWLIEGDISACFDEVDHRILENILREKINDERFIRLINKILRAGYFDLNANYVETKLGAGQGSTVSPTLANIYLDKLDRYMEQVIEEDTLGNQRKTNPEYSRLRRQLKKAKAQRDKEEIKRIKGLLKNTPSRDLFDPNFRRIKYVRYADDFVIGTISSKEYATQLKQRVKEFLENELHLRLNDEKTKITNAKTDKAKFLGFIIKKKNHRPRIYMDINTMIQRLKQKGVCDGSGYPLPIKRLYNAKAEEIVKYGNALLIGFRNGNSGCSNYHEYWRIQYIIQLSIAKTLARKYRISMKKIFKKYGKAITVSYKNKQNVVKEISLALSKTYKRNNSFFKCWLMKIKEPTERKYDNRNMIAGKCRICGKKHSKQMMFHRKRKALMEKPYSPIEDYMLHINRRQISLCEECFYKAENKQTIDMMIQ